LAFGIKREELKAWKEKIDRGEIAFLTHYWYDDRFPDCNTVTKVGCRNQQKLTEWGESYGLKPEWIHYRANGYSHFDLLGEYEQKVLKAEPSASTKLFRKKS